MANTRSFERANSNLQQTTGRKFGAVQTADSYRDLRFGPQFDRAYEEQVGVPVDGSNSFLRQLSPFTISLLPPLAFENVPTLWQSTSATVRRGFNNLALSAENLFNQALEEAPALADIFGGTNPVPATVGSSPVENPGDLTEHFSLRDFASRGRAVPPELQGNIQSLAEQLEIALGVFAKIKGYPVTMEIICGWRSQEHNDALRDQSEGVAKTSQHLLGKAADIRVEGFSPAQVVGVLNNLMDSGVITQGGLGFYPGPENNFTHYDIRGKRQRWEEKEVPEGLEVDTIAKAIQVLPSGPTPTELARLQDEMGYSGPLQRRTVPAAPPPDIPLLDTASQYDTWQEAKDNRTLGALRLMGSDIGGRGSNRVAAEKFISAGLERTSDSGNGAFQEPGLADRLVAVDIASQLDTILKAPPLTLLINPASLSITHTKIQQFSQRTRKGYLFQAWGEEQQTLSISGSIGAFTAGAASGSLGPFTTSPTGVQFASKRDSASYQNLMALLGFYKHAGYIYDTIGKTNAHHFIGALAIEYDQWVYVGQFESFSWGHEEATQNGKITFDMEFKVSQMFDNHQPSESVQPLRAATESRSDPNFVTGLGSRLLSYFNLDSLPDGTSTPPDDFGQTSSPSLPLEEFPEDTPTGGGQTSIPTNDSGFQAAPEEAPEEVITQPYCVHSERLDFHVCYETLEEAQSILSQLLEFGETDAVLVGG